MEAIIRRSKLIKNKEEVTDEIKEYIKQGNGILQNFDKNKFANWMSVVSEYFKQVFDKPDNEYKKDFDNCAFFSSNEEKLNEKISNLTGFLDKLELIPSGIEEIEADVKYDTKKIFIVHGHDAELKEKVARTLEKLELEPIILHEQENRGKTIIEKFENNADTCGFAIILLTADDWGYNKEENEDSKRPRARQNVVFEMGFFIGKLGRDRVFLLLDKDVEKPGDLDGIVYQSTGNEDWKQKLVQELKSSGYNVDANKLYGSI